MKRPFHDKAACHIFKRGHQSTPAAGFEDAPKRGKGSHSALIKRGIDKARLVIVPDRKELPRGTLRAILDQAGLTKEDFIELLNKL